MMEKLSQALGDLARNLSGKGSISEKNIEDAVESIKAALLDADVNLRVVRRFVNSTIEEAKGERVLRAVKPGEMFVKLIHDKLTSILGEGRQDLALKGPDTVSTILLLGLQGSGKTTTAAKLALHLKGRGRRVLLAACDRVRPAAIEQLRVMGEKVGVPVFLGDGQDAVKVSQAALAEAKRGAYDVLIVDSSGRMQIDQDLMAELELIKKAVDPVESLLVVDAMTGQIAADIAKTFDERIGLSGHILTKFDSDARGGAALSLKSVTGKPIKFVGVSEKPEGLEPFYPERVASRILGMGDIVSLVEKAQATMAKEEAEKLERKIRGDSFTLEDYLDQLRRMRKMGSMKEMLEMIPGMSGQVDTSDLEANSQVELRREEAIILSMTPKERRNAIIIGPSRRARIARGSGTSVAEVARFLKKFDKTTSMMRKMAKNKDPMARRPAR